MLRRTMSHPTMAPSTAAEEKYQALLAAVRTHHPKVDVAVLQRAFGAVRAQQLQPSGDGPQAPLLHALEAAQRLADMRLDPEAVVASLLVAAAPAQGAAEVAQQRADYGAQVVDLLEGVRRLAGIRWDRIEEESAESLRKMFLAMARDIRVVLIVLAWRVPLMRALRDSALPDEDKRRLASETLEVFAPLANRLGIWQIKWALEDWSLRVLQPQTFHELTQCLAERREEREAFIEEVMGILREKLAAAGIEATIKGRPKHIYSIYKKMERKALLFENVYDVSAVRVVTDAVESCYAVLGLVHASWTPVAGEFDDYIACPKANGYQSLHTAVVGPRGKPFEVQIRTRQMHQFAEHGVAAHWAYKENKKADGTHEKFRLLRQLMDWEREVADPHQFVESLKTDIFQDQVYVFTPNGDVIDLPQGATPLDFAYRIHTQVGHRCRGARVNDQIVPLDYPLKTGERVEILTQKQPSPSRDWMNANFGYLRTNSARQKVRHWYREQNRQTAIAQGKELVERELSRLALRHATIEDIVATLRYANADELYAAVGHGDRSSQSVASAALQAEREQLPADDQQLPPSIPPPKTKRSTSGLSLHGVDDILGKRARCCHPVPGDSVVGFVTRGRGLMIHRRDCNNIVSSREPERLVDIQWGPSSDERHRVDVEVQANDRPGLLRDLSALVSNAGVNVAAAKASSGGGRGGSAWLRLSLECTSAQQIVKVLQLLSRHAAVLEVRRVAR